MTLLRELKWDYVCKHMQSTKQIKLVKQDSSWQNLEGNTVYSGIFTIKKKKEEVEGVEGVKSIEVSFLDLKIITSQIQD